MLNSLPNPEQEAQPVELRNPWAIVDLIVFGIFSFMAFIVLAFTASKFPEYVIPLQGLFDAALVVFIACWVRIVRGESFSRYIRFIWSSSFSTRTLITLGAGLAVAASLVSVFLKASAETPLEKFLNSTGAILLFVVLGVTVAPLMEEIVFRGFLFKVFSELGGFRLAVPATAVLFAVPHLLQLAGNSGAAITVFIVGAVLSVLRHRSNSVIPPIIVHTSYNATLFLLSPVGAVFEKFFK